MCGIAGLIGKHSLPDEVITRTLHVMRQRGPDHRAAVTIPLGDTVVTLLHARLAILDLDARSNQPFQRGALTTAYNGEIYNYKELRAELVREGEDFRTESDTEVMLASLSRFGLAAGARWEGMWACAVVDEARHEFILSRDRFGEKPLYLFEDSRGLWFASETRILKELVGKSFEVDEEYLVRGAVLGFRTLIEGDRTCYREVRRFPAGHHLRIDREGKREWIRFWEPQRPRDSYHSFEQSVAEFGQAFENSLRLRLRSDVPLAFCLSGGVDSGSIVSVAAKKLNAKVVTFSIVDPDQRYHELDNIRATIDDVGCEHHIVELQKEGFLARLADLVRYHDKPLATISYYVHALLSDAIGGAGYKVVFSGTGADELLSGYYEHALLHLEGLSSEQARKRADADFNSHLRPFIRNPTLSEIDRYQAGRATREQHFIETDSFASFVRRPFDYTRPTVGAYTSSALRNQMWTELFSEVVPVILVEDDLNSMRSSIENRSPFLDTRIFDVCARVPDEQLVRDGYLKAVLRESIRGVLNEKVRTDRRKVGFNASLQSLCDFESPEFCEFLERPSRFYEMFEKAKVREFFGSRRLSDAQNKFAFNLIALKMFLDCLGA